MYSAYTMYAHTVLQTILLQYTSIHINTHQYTSIHINTHQYTAYRHSIQTQHTDTAYRHSIQTQHTDAYMDRSSLSLRKLKKPVCQRESWVLESKHCARPWHGSSARLRLTGVFNTSTRLCLGSICLKFLDVVKAMTLKTASVKWLCCTKVGKNVNRTGGMPHAERESVYHVTGHSQRYKFCFSGYFLLTIQTQLMGSHWRGQPCRKNTWGFLCWTYVWFGCQSHSCSPIMRGFDATTVVKTSSRHFVAACPSLCPSLHWGPDSFCVDQALVSHPRDVIPPFTHAMMKKACRDNPW